MLDVGKMVDAVLEAIDKPLRVFAERIKALEARVPERGEKGDPGLVGPPGEKGDKGEAGRDAGVMVPPELADQVAGAVRTLHEAPPLVDNVPATAKLIRIERDGNGSLVPVYE